MPPSSPPGSFSSMPKGPFLESPHNTDILTGEPGNQSLPLEIGGRHGDLLLAFCDLFCGLELSHIYTLLGRSRSVEQLVPEAPPRGLVPGRPCPGRRRPSSGITHLPAPSDARYSASDSHIDVSASTRCVYMHIGRHWA